MIISFSKRFLFVHVPKTAGESLRELLLNPTNGGAQFMRKHASYAEARGILGAEMGRFTTFAVVRNPFDQVVSFYEHLRKPLHMTVEEIEQQWPGSNGKVVPHWASELAMRLPFPDYIQRVYAEPEGPSHLLRDQCAWLVDPAGQDASMRLLRFENLAGEFSALAAELTLEGSLPWRNESRARQDRGRHREWYDEASRAVIARHFSRTLERFGYEF